MFNIRISQKTKTNVLLLIVAALSVSYIMNKQISALLSLLLLTGLGYMLSKNIVISLALSIIITNLLLSLNYFVVEGATNLAEGSVGAPPNTIGELEALVGMDEANRRRNGPFT